MITENHDDGWSGYTRPNRIRCKSRLSNGQWLFVEFKRIRQPHPQPLRCCYIWSVAIHIGDRRKIRRRWTKKPQQTGRAGLEGLREALRIVKSFGYDMCDYRDEMRITWADERRRRAYRYLLRFDGFEDHGEFIAFRNPDYYEWEGSGKDEKINSF